MEWSSFANKYTIISLLIGDEDLRILWWLSSFCISCALYHSKHYVLLCCKVRINKSLNLRHFQDVDGELGIFLLFAVFSFQDQSWACCLVQWLGTVLWFLTRPLLNRRPMRLCQGMWTASQTQLGANHAKPNIMQAWPLRAQLINHFCYVVTVLKKWPNPKKK